MNPTSKSENICYKTDGIINWLDGYRNKWDDFYPSEKWAFTKLAGPTGDLGSILDVGCAMGGLGLALSRKFKITKYTGIDINPQAFDRAESLKTSFPMPVRFEQGDIVRSNKFDGESFDTVFSLGCADWNIETDSIIHRCWEFVKPRGSFVMSVRLTSGEGINDITRSHQSIFCDEEGNVLESANYVVFNWQEFLRFTQELLPAPSGVSAYGYWGKPSSNAVTPYPELVFAVFIIRKPAGHDVKNKTQIELSLPLNLLTDK